MTGPTPKTRAIVYDRAGLRCEVCGGSAYGGSVHHRRRRGMGGSKRPEINLPANLLLLCGSGTTGCHGDIEAHRAGAYVDGLLLRENQEPTTTPVQLIYGLVLLDNDGLWTPTEGTSL